MASQTSSIPFAKSRATLVSTATSLGGLSIGAIGDLHRPLQYGFALCVGEVVTLGANFRGHASAPSLRLASAPGSLRRRLFCGTHRSLIAFRRFKVNFADCRKPETRSQADKSVRLARSSNTPPAFGSGRASKVSQAPGLFRVNLGPAMQVEASRSFQIHLL